MAKLNNKNIYFCVDFEEWFHIPYLSKYEFNKNDYETFSDKIIPFMEWLSNHNISCTVFVVADLVTDRAQILKKIYGLGHQIACHSFSHKSINKMTDEEFLKDTQEAKELIEKQIGCQVKGYRAPFFSITTSKLSLLQKLGFSYDSSYICSNANEYYSNDVDLSDYEKIDSLIYEKNGFKEYEIPTINNKPIGGGGFFRLYPFWLFKHFVFKFLKNNNNYIMFIHPYEIAGKMPFRGLKKMNFKDKIRFQLGRKNAVNKTKKTIMMFEQMGFVFKTFD